MKTLFLTLSSLILMNLSSMNQSIHQFSIKSIDGKEINFADFKGKKILVVNVASACGFTSQYKQLQELHEKMGDELVIIGFPCNDFGGQEKGTEEEIKAFCSSKYGVTFIMTEKVKIKGDDAHPIYQFLTNKEKNGVMDAKVKWNFHKFLLDENGKLQRALPSTASPTGKEIMDWMTS